MEVVVETGGEDDHPMTALYQLPAEVVVARSPGEIRCYGVVVKDPDVHVIRLQQTVQLSGVPQPRLKTLSPPVLSLSPPKLVADWGQMPSLR